MQDREVHLAEVKKRSEEYRASKASSTPAAASASAPVAAKGNFSF
jgi:hypothetical protein